MENIIELIQEYCEDEGFTFNGCYNGKGMFERNCIGIICDNPLQALWGLFAYIVDSNENLEGYEIKDLLGEPCEDQLGIRYILYFPKLKAK
ncbi:hypothetical protein ACP5WL_28010 [Enterocloster bolteae]|uniref:hypothetical protein n=1 Tax=Lachnospiraceae TaxID=186803 RepID=UPI000E44934C|nr:MULTISPECIES: hypothetical protein [Hungatella]RGO63380.1 hypothetical protein DXB08_32825 [Hungatella hathewayi]